MGCNAYNHPSDCNCGWGGDTSWMPRSIVADGTIWRSDRQPTSDSFINPNALCPVCGAPVFFYQSPFGGRVFFDELGPPWPKHPCTDNGTPPKVYTSTKSSSQKLPSAFLPRDAWRPLIAKSSQCLGEFDRIILDGDSGFRGGFPGRFICVPTATACHSPAFWRWIPSNPAMVEVSTIQVTKSGDVESQAFSVPCWFRSDNDFALWRASPNVPLPPDALNAVGWSLSFAWRLAGKIWPAFKLPGIDFPLAKHFFEAAASQGCWQAANNLGVMYRDGLGQPVDHAKAFELFERAAQSLEPIPLRHLAQCYREGVGCDRDPEFSEFLEELALVAQPYLRNHRTKHLVYDELNGRAAISAAARAMSIDRG